MKTLFITSFNPFISRNILLTDAFKILKGKDGIKIVILVPDYKADFFRENFGASNVIIEGVKAKLHSFQDIFFSYLASSLVDTRNLMVHKREKFSEDRNFLKFCFSLGLLKIGSRINFVKKLVRFADYSTISKKDFMGLFEKYNPRILFSTDVFNNYDVHFLAEARHRQILTIGMIRSWDNVTSKGLFRMKPERLIVHNRIIKEEVLRYEDMKGNNIFISGIPQFDNYFPSLFVRWQMARDAFFQKLGFDPQKKLILFSPLGRRFWDIDWQFAEILKQAIEHKEIPEVQVLVRCTPNDEVALQNFKPSRLFFIDKPGHRFQEGVYRDTEFTVQDLDWLANSLYFSDLVIAAGTTIGIDAAVFNKPVILLGFNGFEKRPYLKSVERFLDFEHTSKVIKSRAFKPVRSREELIEAINFYLINPRTDREYRKQLIQDQCWRLDGRAGARIAGFISKFV